MYGDGGGLYLNVKPTGARSWILRVQVDKKRQDIGLGSADWLSLPEAREKARALRKHAKEGRDPVAERDREKVQVPTFAEAMLVAHKELGRGWIDKNAAAFKTSLERHIVPKMGRVRVDRVDTSDIIAALAPIWTEKPELARKLRLRIMQVLSFAKAKGWRSASLPDRGEMSSGLARQPRKGNFAAVPYVDVPAFVASVLEQSETASRLALLFTILTAARSGEVRFARWEQVDLEARIWTRPAEAMKMRVEHLITLNPAAVAVLKRAAERFGSDGLIFPGVKRGAALSDMTLTKAMRSAGRSETVHGFRSSFRDWTAERMATIPAMVAEMALAHSVGTATEKAYLRSDLRDMRRALMDGWGTFAAPSLSPEASNVVPLQRAATT